MARNALRAGVTALACLSVAGCASPPAVWLKPPERPPGGAPLSAAMAYLDAARDTYRGTVTRQLADEATLGDTLIGAFAMAAGMAVGHVHRDAIFGTSLLAGTAYTVGNRRLGRVRVAAYLAGLDALNCARRAVAPFGGDVDALVVAADQLQAALDGLDQPLAVARARYAANVKPDPQHTPGPIAALKLTIDAADLARQASQTSLDSARGFIGASARAATQLVAAIDQIDTAVIKAVAEGTPTLASVPGVIGGLAGLVGSFAPGAGFEALIDDSLKSLRGATAMAGVSADDAVAAENLALMQAASRLRTAQAQVNALLVSRATPWPEDAFKDCQVAQVVTPLAAAPASLNFVAGVDARRTVTLSGGVKPYFVEVDGEGRDGFTVKPPMRFDARIEVSVNGSKLKDPLTTSLLVMDSSPNPRPLAIPIVVGPASGAASAPPAAPAAVGALVPAAAPAPASAPVAAAPTLEQAFAALKPIATFKLDGAAYQVLSLPERRPDGSGLVVRLQCPLGASTTTRSRILQALLAQAGIASSPAARPWTLELAPNSPNCPAA